MYTYFYKDGEKTKIGKTIDPARRLNEGLTMNPDIVQIRVLPFDIENKLHRLFDKYQLVREWYMTIVVEEFLKGIEETASEDEYLSYIDRYKDVINSLDVMQPTDILVKGYIAGILASLGYVPSGMIVNKRARGCEYVYANKRLAMFYVSVNKLKGDIDYMLDSDKNLTLQQWRGLTNHISNILNG